jgi:hypothetical protein
MVQTTDENGKPVTIDPTDLDQIKRQIDVPGVMKAVTAARGKEQTYKGDRYKATPNDLKYTQDTYAYGNKPKQFFDSMSLSATQNPTKFLNTLQEPSPQEYIKTEQEYYAAMTPEVKKAWRIGEGEELPDDEGLSDVQKAIKYQAMKYAIMNPPRKSPSYITDEEQKMADEEAKQKRLISYRESVGDIYKKARIDYRNSANDQQKEGVIQKLVDDSFDAGQQKVATAVNGKYTPARLISVPVEFAKQYEKADPKLSGAKVRPVFYMTEDKKYVVPRYPREESYGQTPIPIKTYKAEIGKIILSKKDNEAEIELDNTNPEKPTTSPATKTKKSKVGALN